MPHQQHILDVALEIDPQTGLLAYGEVLLIGPRQATGKSELLLALMTHRCVGFDDGLARWVRAQLRRVVPPPGAQRVLYMAQTTDDARLKWRDAHVARLRKSPFYRPRPKFQARLQRASEAMLWENGSVWSPGSTLAGKAGTGDTLDLGVIDEAWARPDNRTELGMRPTMMTRPWSQLWVASMIPGISRVLPEQWQYLRGKRETGRALLAAGVRHGTAIFDYSAPPGLDPGDPDTWYTCIPGLGRTVAQAKVATDYTKLDLVDFCAEYLGWEPAVTAPRWSLLARSRWDGELRDAGSRTAGPVALGVEVSEDRTRAVVGVAGHRSDGLWHVEVVEPGLRVPVTTAGIDWVLPAAAALYRAQNACAVVVDPRRPALTLVAGLKAAGLNVLTPNQSQIAGGCGRFYDATGAGGGVSTLRHLGQDVLDRAVGQARKFDLPGGAFTFVRRGAGADLGPLYAVVLAMVGVESAGVEAPEDETGDVW